MHEANGIPVIDLTTLPFTYLARPVRILCRRGVLAAVNILDTPDSFELAI